MATYGVRLRRSDNLVLPPHPASCAPDDVATWAADLRTKGHRLAVDLFSGAGGLSLGLEEAGWVVGTAVDSDPRAVATHAHNFPGLALQSDLGDASSRGRLVRQLRQLGEVDLVAGGPPCQPFSRAGHSKIRDLVRRGAREQDDHRRELWLAFMDVVLRLRPRAVLMENVPDMALGDEFRAVRTMTEMLEGAGYYTQLRIVDAWAHGVPQHRRRLILLARRDVDQFTWPDRTERPNLREAIGDLPDIVGDVGVREAQYEESWALSDYAHRMRRGATTRTLFDHMTRPVRDDDRETFSLMNSRTLYSDLPAELRRYRADSFTDKYKRLSWNDLSRSITAHIARDGYWYIHPDQPRTLTVREAARIQTFPDRFRFAGTRSDAFRQIGNAVPPMLGVVAATALQPPSQPEPHQRPRRRAQVKLTRNALVRWAQRQRESLHWYTLPGPDVTAPVAAASALLSVQVHDPRTVSRALTAIRGRPTVDLDDLLAVETTLPTAPARRAVRRLESLTLGGPEAWSAPAEDIAQRLGLQSAQTDVMLMLSNQDVLLENQGAIRVAARVAGSTSHTVNRLTDGRVDLARLVGAGDDSALRMGALRLLGRTVCQEADPGCTQCPLARHCKTFGGSSEIASHTFEAGSAVVA